MTGPTLLVDIGSTVVKLCLHDGDFGDVRTVSRDFGVSPGEQVRALVEDLRRSVPAAAVRVCSSANGGLRVGVVGLSRRHSLAVATRAAVAAGANVVYARLFDDPLPAPPVDLLVLAGGVDGADLCHLSARVAAVCLADLPHEVVVWAGAHAPDIVAGLPVDHVVPNVLDKQLRPAMRGLADLVHRLYVDDLVDHKGLRALTDAVDAPVRPTPAVVGLAAERLTGERVIAPFVVVDVGGATTDVFHCVELGTDHTARIAPGESVVRRVFPDLGVASSLPRLRHRLATEPGLIELTNAIAPARSRMLYHEICDDAELEPSTSFLACLFLALRQITTRDRAVDPHRIAGVLVTGGAWRTATEPAIRRVVDAACGTPGARWSLHLDRRYQLWAQGLLAVPTGPAASPATSPAATLVTRLSS